LSIIFINKKTHTIMHKKPFIFILVIGGSSNEKMSDFLHEAALRGDVGKVEEILASHGHLINVQIGQDG
jgi:hypothetical protein